MPCLQKCHKLLKLIQANLFNKAQVKRKTRGCQCFSLNCLKLGRGVEKCFTFNLFFVQIQ